MHQGNTHNTLTRILFVENGIGYGGAIICLRHLVRNLDRSRFLPMVVTGKDDPRYREIAREAEWRHIADRRLDIPELRRRIEDSRLARWLPGCQWVLNQIVSRLDDLVNFLPFFTRFLWTARTFQPALIHANNEPVCNRAAILAGKILRIPVICHMRGNTGGLGRLRWLYHLPDHYIPVSQWVSDGLGELGVPDSSRTVVYDGISLGDLKLDADGAPFRARFGIAPDAFAVGLVGLLIPWKGQKLFVEAARILAAEVPGLRMLIIGGTPAECTHYEAGIRQLVADQGLEECVTLTGNVDDMPATYNALDVVVSASTTPEPLGTMVIECMAMGRPLIGPAHGGAAEMAEHDRTALLFEPGNARALADAIRRLYLEPALRTRLGNAARKKALATFAVDEHVRRIQAVYDARKRAA